MSEGVLIALITSIGALIGGIVSAVINANAIMKTKPTAPTQTSFQASSKKEQGIQWSWGIFLIGAIVGGIVLLGITAFAGFLPITFPSFTPVPLYRYNNLSNSDHMYTTNPNKNLDGWIFEGNEGYVYMSKKAETIPLYEFYNQKNLQHFYSTDKNLGSNNSDFELQGIAAYVYAEQKEKTIPLYRYFNPETGGYFYTTNFDEVGNGNGLKYEKIECYVLAENP